MHVLKKYDDYLLLESPNGNQVFCPFGAKSESGTMPRTPCGSWCALFEVYHVIKESNPAHRQVNLHCSPSNRFYDAQIEIAPENTEDIFDGIE